MLDAQNINSIALGLYDIPIRQMLKTKKRNEQNAKGKP